MTFTPHISIYPEGEIPLSWLGDAAVRAILIYSKNLQYNRNLAGKRVNIHFGNEERVHTQGSIKSIWIKNTINSLQQVGYLIKIEYFLKVIYQSLLTIAEIEGWDKSNFEKAYQLSVADGGKFIWYTPFRTNKNRSIKARIRISLDRDGKVPIVAEFFDNKSSPKFEVLIIDTLSHYIDWQRVFEKPAWLDNDKFGYSFLNAQLQIFANVTTNQSETRILEKEWSREEIEFHMERLTYSRPIC